MGKGGRYARKKAKKPRIGLKILLSIVCFFVVLLLGTAGFAVTKLNSMLDDVNHVEVPKIQYTKPAEAVEQTLPKTDGDAEPASTEAVSPAAVSAAEPVDTSSDYVNFLLVGQQARREESARLADTMILCTVNTKTKTLTMTSLLRDSFVKMPDYKGHIGGRIKLNTIYHLGSTYGDGIAGSMELMNLTLFNNFGIEVDHNFEIDFTMFIEVIDLLGGVEIELTAAEARYMNADNEWVETDVKEGLQHLDGKAALSYARMRKADGDGESDINRTSRQRKLIEALLGKVRTKNLSEIQKIANEVLPLIATSMSKSEITDCLMTMVPMLPELTIKSGDTCPANYSGNMVDIYGDGVMHSVLHFNVEETTKAMRAITEGETE